VNTKRTAPKCVFANANKLLCFLCCVAASLLAY